jgi:hypothetical protein
VIQLEVDVSALRAAAARVGREAERIDELATARQSRIDVLRAIYEDIEAFGDLAAAKQAVIDDLIRSREATIAGLTLAAANARAWAAENLAGAASAIARNARRLQSHVVGEDDAFAAAHLNTMHFSDVGCGGFSNTLVGELAVNRLRVDSVFPDITNALGDGTIIAPEMAADQLLQSAAQLATQASVIKGRSTDLEAASRLYVTLFTASFRLHLQHAQAARLA